MTDFTCTRCPELVASRTQIVRGRGNPHADIMCVGEAPGQNEDRTGKAFCGKAGQVLACLLEQAGIELSRVYLANSCCCRPPGNRTPKIDEVRNCREHLLEEIARVQPKVIICLGVSALKSLWGTVPIGDVLGQSLIQQDTGIPLIPTYHPAYVMRSWKAAPVVLAHMQKALRIADEGLGQQELGEYLPCTWVDAVRAARDYLLSDDTEAIAFDTETTGLSWMADELMCISLSPESGLAFIIPILRQNLEPAWTDEEWPEVRALIGEILSSSKAKVAQNASFDLRFLEREADWPCVEAKTAFGWKVNNLKWDTLILSRAICQEVPHNLDALLAFFTDTPYYSGEVAAASKRKRHMEAVPDEVLWKYAGADADMVMRLLPVLLEQIREQGTEWLFEKIVTPTIRSCWEMEKRGLLIDQTLFDTLADHYTKELAEAEKALFELVGAEVNWKDYRSVQRLLFETCKIPIPNERTDGAAGCKECRASKGHPCIKHVKTDRQTLESLNLTDPHPVLPVLAKLKKLEKFNGTYLAGGQGGYGRFIRPDGRIHATFKVGFADTGRHSCEDPNLQNTPKELEVPELGLKDALRQIFVAPPGHVMMTADWAQVEVWMLAYQTQDPKLLNLLQTGQDVHTYVGRALGRLGISRFFPDVDPELDDYEWQKVHGDIRRRAKVFTFGIPYGLTGDGTADRLGCTVDEGELLTEAYKTQVFASLEELFQQVEEEIITKGRLLSMLGRHRVFSQVPVLQLLGYQHDIQEAIRIGVNFLCQSTAHDLHQAAHNQTERCPEIIARARPVLEVHDSLSFEAVDKGQEYLIQTAWLIKELWEKTAQNLMLPSGKLLGWECPVEVSWGPSLGETVWKLTPRGDLLDVRGLADEA